MSTFWIVWACVTTQFQNASFKFIWFCFIFTSFARKTWCFLADMLISTHNKGIMKFKRILFGKHIRLCSFNADIKGLKSLHTFLKKIFVPHAVYKLYCHCKWYFCFMWEKKTNKIELNWIVRFEQNGMVQTARNLSIFLNHFDKALTPLLEDVSVAETIVWWKTIT